MLKLRRYFFGISVSSFWLASGAFFTLLTSQAWSEPVTPPTPSPQITPSPANGGTEGFTVFSVGVNIDQRNVLPSILIWGKENGKEAVNFENWHIPYGAVIDALHLNTKVLPDGRLELRSSIIVATIDPKQLYKDPKLGLVFSVKEIETLFGLKVTFDINEYAIVFNLPSSAGQNETNNLTEKPLQLEGLPRIAAPTFTLSAIQENITATASSSSQIAAQGDLTAYGTAYGGSFYFRINQPTLEDYNTWNLAEGQFLRQTDQADYIVGSQQIFWPNQSNNTSGDYWGFTTIQRQGFTSPIQLGAGGTSTIARLQASEIGQTITGQAAPGTLVRLMQGYSNRVLAEVLVDSSGIYRFENVPVLNMGGGNYRVFLYPRGQLTAQPEIRDATFSIVSGQLPVGASALVVSAGFNRQLPQTPSLFGTLSTANFYQMKPRLKG